MKAVDVFRESCKAFESHGIVPSFVKDKNLWLAPSYEEYVNRLRKAIEASHMSVAYKQFLLQSTQNKSIDTVKATGPAMYIVFCSAEQSRVESVSLLLNFLYYTAKIGCEPIRPAGDRSVLKYEILNDAPIVNTIDLAASMLKFDSAKTESAPQAIPEPVGLRPNGAAQRLIESCVNFQEWGIRCPNDINSVLPETYGFDSLRDDINAALRTAKLRTEFTQEALYSFLCSATSTLDLCAIIFAIASASNISDFLLKDLILKLIYVEAYCCGRTVDKSARPITLAELRKDAEENYNILDCRAMVDDIIRYSDSDEKEELSIAMTEGTASIANLVAIFEGVYRAHGMMCVLTTINAAIKTMPEASIQSDFYRLLKHYMDEEVG